MNEVLFHLSWWHISLVITGWKLVGYAGTFMFCGRWVVQFWASHTLRKPTMPRLFWYMSLSGSALLLAYFIWGKNDSVGVMSNLFPTFVASYNLYLDFKHQEKAG